MFELKSLYVIIHPLSDLEEQNTMMMMMITITMLMTIMMIRARKKAGGLRETKKGNMAKT